MRLPRNISGDQFIALLRRYGYEQARQTGSHVRLTSHFMDREHHVSVPRHRVLRLGTLDAVLAEVAEYLGMDKDALAEELFGRTNGQRR